MHVAIQGGDATRRTPVVIWQALIQWDNGQSVHPRLPTPNRQVMQLISRFLNQRDDNVFALFKCLLVILATLSMLASARPRVPAAPGSHFGTSISSRRARNKRARSDCLSPAHGELRARWLRRPHLPAVSLSVRWNACLIGRTGARASHPCHFFS